MTVRNAVVVLTQDDIARTLTRLTTEMLEANQGSQQLVLVGIVTRGKFLADRVAKLVQELDHKTVPVGYLDITLYRDDATIKATQQSHMPVDLNDKHVVLVDDVLKSGRTIRAAMDALTAYGRPASVQLMVLVDRRGHRELPIAATFVGKDLPTSKSERVNVVLHEVDGEEAVSITSSTGA
jgi:pyrimidine operon attenuation protein / uracil phosphoribosyltransferase